MKKTQQQLMLLFGTFLVLSAAIYVAGEFLHYDMSIFDDASHTTRFCIYTTMILLTVIMLPLALRLFKFRKVSDDLHLRQAAALRQWGSLRLIVMGLLLLVNTALYYAFGLEASYGYLAVVTLLCFPFVIPTMSRCKAELSSTDESEYSDNSKRSDEEANSSHSQL